MICICHAHRPQIAHTRCLMQPRSRTCRQYILTPRSFRRLKVTLAGARDHVGIRFSSVNKEKRSSADAWNVASTLTIDVLIFCEDAAAFLAGPEAALLPVADADGGAGEPVRLASFEPTMISLPCASTRSTGNAANLASRAVGSLAFASSKSTPISGEEGDVRDH